MCFWPYWPTGADGKRCPEIFGEPQISEFCCRTMGLVVFLEVPSYKKKTIALNTSFFLLVIFSRINCRGKP